MTCLGVRLVRDISRIDCCAKIGRIAPRPARRRASTCPGVARPRRSPKPKLAARASVEGGGATYVREEDEGVVVVIGCRPLCRKRRRLRACNAPDVYRAAEAHE